MVLRKILIKCFQLIRLPRVFDFLGGVLTEARIRPFDRGLFVSIGNYSSIIGGKYISIDDGAFIGSYSHIHAIRNEMPGTQYCGQIRIGRNFQATGDLQIYSVVSVEIGDSVLIARNVFICDCLHGHSNLISPFKDQPFEKIKPIKIGSGSWIGQNVVILPGVTIGSNVIIGANAVVTDDIPSATIAVGVPARVIKRFDEKLSCWVNI